MGLQKGKAQMPQPRAFWTTTPSQDLGSFSKVFSFLGAGDKGPHLLRPHCTGSLKNNAWLSHDFTEACRCRQACGKPRVNPPYSFKAPRGWGWVLEGEAGRPLEGQAGSYQSG